LVQFSEISNYLRGNFPGTQARTPTEIPALPPSSKFRRIRAHKRVWMYLRRSWQTGGEHVVFRDTEERRVVFVRLTRANCCPPPAYPLQLAHIHTRLTTTTDNITTNNNNIINSKYYGLEDKCIFQPIAVESLGPLNETACQFLKDLGRRISAQSGDERVPSCSQGYLLSLNDSTLSCSTTV